MPYRSGFRMPLKVLFEKAAKLASDGVSVNEELADAIGKLQSDAVPDDLKALLTKDDNATYLKGNDTLRQPILAETLLVSCLYISSSQTYVV